MSIAEQIMLGTAQQQKSWSVLSDNLSRLGQQVGQQLAMQEYQKQAAEALPAMQQTYSNALDKIQSGQLAQGYKDITNAQLKYGSSQNPFIANMNEMAGSVAEKAVSDFMQTRLAGIQYGGRGQTSTASGIPGVNKRVYGYQDETNADETDTGTSPTDPSMNAVFVNPDIPQEFDANGNPVVEVPLPNNAQVPAATPSVTPAPTPSASPAPAPTPQGTPQQQAGRQNASAVFELPVNQQATAARQFSLTQDSIDPKKYELVKVPGMEEYLDGFVGFAVPTKKWEETSTRELQSGDIVRGTEKVTPQARKNFFEGINNQPSTEQVLKASVEAMKDRQMTALYNEFGRDIFALRAATGVVQDSQGKNIYTVLKKDGNEQTITGGKLGGQYEAIQAIASIVPATAENAGGTPAIFKKGKLTQEQAIEAAINKLGPKATDDQIANEVRKLLAQ